MKPKPLTKQINIRLTASDLRKTYARARKRGFASASAYLRYLLLEDEAKRAAIPVGG
jgi:Arc/MetJ-type ribon-helix-helix transcriptional regulator